MKRVLLSIVFGIFAPIVFILGAEPFEVVGSNSIKETIAGCFAVILFLAICQFLIARKSGKELRAKWPTLAGMAVPLFLWAPIIDPQAFVAQGLPMMASGCIGILAGGIFAGRVTLPAVSRKSYRGSLKFCRGSLLISAALLVVVALVVTAGVVPPVKADTFLGAAPERAVPVLWWGVALSVLTAMLLVFIAIRATDRARLSHAALGILAFLAVVLACLLIPPAFAYQSHGPAMQTASILLFLCTAGEIFAAVLVILVMFLLREEA